MSDMQNVIDKAIEECAVGDIIYPGKVAKEAGMTLVDVYDDLLKKKNLRGILEPCCDNCNQMSGMWFDAFWDVPTEFFCPHCGKKIDNAGGDAIVVFRKIK